MLSRNLSLLIPITILGIIPYLVHAGFDSPSSIPGMIRWAGVPIFLSGLLLGGWSARIFFTFGQGTPAPWDPPKRFVLMGPYRHVRNPMMLGGFMMIFGETLLFGSLPILAYLAALILFGHIYIVAHEEKELARRFGHPYLAYKRYVPRWLPRFRWGSGPAADERSLKT
jgi:protein-S-isoprenylcysteine O-methyltransferase Ste14